MIDKNLVTQEMIEAGCRAMFKLEQAMRDREHSVEPENMDDYDDGDVCRAIYLAMHSARSVDSEQEECVETIDGFETGATVTPNPRTFPMTDKELDALIERLLSHRFVREIWHEPDGAMGVDCDADDDGAEKINRNPDGRQAAAAITTLRERVREVEKENEELRFDSQHY